MFYISSRGSSGNEWLAKVLSKHPKIVCFRATRSFPPVSAHRASPNEDSGIPQISADKFIEGLLECSRATHNEKIFGSIHGYHGIVAKEACEKRGGIFSFTIRHPVSRIHSVFIYYLYYYYYQKYNTGIGNSDIHNHVCSLLSKGSGLMKSAEIFESKKPEAIEQILYNPGKKMAKNILPDTIVDALIKTRSSLEALKKRVSRSRHNPAIVPDEVTYASNLFTTVAESFFSLEYQLYDGCPLDYGIKMEEMVKSKEYFKSHLWKRVAPQLRITDSYLESVFSEGRFNVHRDAPLSPEEIWKTWPSGMKECFLYYFEKYNISKICKDWDYDVSFM